MLSWYLAILGLTLGAGAAISLNLRLASRRSRMQVEGQLVDWLAMANAEAPTETYYYKKVAYRDTAGVEHTFVSRIGLPVRGAPVGAPVKVSYDITDPGNAREVGFVAEWGWSLALAALSSLCFLSAVGLPIDR